MTLNSKTLAALLVVILFGGIMISSAFGWWNTESTKEPAKFTEGEFAGTANPADIRGSYTFGDVEKAFGISPAIMAQAFGVGGADPAAFQLKELETIYAESPVEIGTASVRMFVAFYAGLPYDLATAEETYLPKSAVDILLEAGKLTAEQGTFLETHTATPGEPAAAPAPASTVAATAAAEATPHATSTVTAYAIKGKTVFGDLITWKVPQAAIEQVIGAPMPDPATSIKDFCATKGLDFEVIRPALQAEVDKIKP
ncbi:MAG: hypothetical protein NT121_07475 [Chloroflexi bacterium]|nr:hypothetical protein [Chloroflexota bacterium]